VPQRSSGIEVHGLRELMRGLNQVDEEIVRDMKDEMMNAGELVRKDAAQRFSEFDRFSAQGFKTRVRPYSLQSTITIEQNLRKTTGKHPEWGALQMTKALIPARVAQTDVVVQRLEKVVDRVLKTHGF
jgi:hypothetical protein